MIKGLPYKLLLKNDNINARSKRGEIQSLKKSSSISSKMIEKTEHYNKGLAASSALQIRLNLIFFNQACGQKETLYQESKIQQEVE